MTSTEGETDLLGRAASLRFTDATGSISLFSKAVRELTAAGDVRQAAMACAQLGDVFANEVGNLTAARAWFWRAARLVENEPPCVEQGWVAIASLGCDVDDPNTLLTNAEFALERARQFGDVNLETKALADGGLAHVQSGRTAEGMALLDEAMALASGPVDDLDTAGKSVCSFFTACYFACDFDRAASWANVLRSRGIIGAELGAPVFLSGHCDAVQATLLGELGQWTQAETLLLNAMEVFEEVMGMPSWHPAIALAELRIRQGRLAEAESLLLGKDGHLQALLPAARLHLMRGDTALARATATRGLRVVGEDRLRAAELMTVLVDAALMAGDLDEASAWCESLAERSKGLDVPALGARISSARARTLAAGGNASEALRLLEEEVDRTETDALPWTRLTLLVDIVRLHEQLGNRAGARIVAVRAQACLDTLDIALLPDDAELIVRNAKAETNATAGARFSFDGISWTVTHNDREGRVRDSKGMRYLAELVRAPGAERHALDLIDRVEGVGEVDRRHLGDAGELLDGHARAAYRHRVESLRSEIDEALAVGSLDHAEVLQTELDQLVAELARAFGLGGRDRRAAAVPERARVNVTRALRTAIARIGEVLPDLGANLDREIRTGLYCAFAPTNGEPVQVVVHSK